MSRLLVRSGGRTRAATRAAIIIGALALLPGSVPVLAASGSGRVTVFATAPTPGHPFGVAVDGGRVYVSTSAGDFFADPANGGFRNFEDERVFTYDLSGRLLETAVIDTADGSDMGLFGLAVDGNPGPDRHLYVADMNGRILRLSLDRQGRATQPELFSQVPVDTGLAGDWMLAMWNDLSFDRAGNLYVTDDKPRIWRVSPDGEASIWLTDPRLAGLFGIAGGPLGGRIDPTGTWLYVAITVSAEFPGEGTIYRIRLVDHPTAADVQLVHRFPVTGGPTDPGPQPTTLAFAKSGNLYVSLLGPNQVAVLDPAGNEIRRISDPRFLSPWGLAFVGSSLLVTNGDLEPGVHPEAWQIFRVNVGEPGLALIKPRM
jgi:sugar lactone lactonase YvrE